jgi:acyl-CoA synthetase (AMP-forming)/AMP-acid ligase II
MAPKAGLSNHELMPSILHGPATPVPLNMTFGELLDSHVEVRGDQAAVISHPQGTTVSWRELSERSIKMARALAEDGVEKGTLVAISLGSRIEYFETFFACARLGAALVMLNYAYAESEMLALLKVVCRCHRLNTQNNDELLTDRYQQVRRFSSHHQVSRTTTTRRYCQR